MFPLGPQPDHGAKGQAGGGAIHHQIAAIPADGTRQRRHSASARHIAHIHQNLPRLDVLQFVDEQFAIRCQRDSEMWERPRRGTFHFCAIRFELAAVARAGNHVGVRLPLRNATKMRAHSGHRIETFQHAHDVHLLVLQKSHRMHRIKIGIAGAKGRRGLEQDVGRKKLIGHGNGP